MSYKLLLLFLLPISINAAQYDERDLLAPAVGKSGSPVITQPEATDTRTHWPITFHGQALSINPERVALAQRLVQQGEVEEVYAQRLEELADAAMADDNNSAPSGPATTTTTTAAGLIAAVSTAATSYASTSTASSSSHKDDRPDKIKRRVTIFEQAGLLELFTLKNSKHPLTQNYWAGTVDDLYHGLKHLAEPEGSAEEVAVVKTYLATQAATIAVEILDEAKFVARQTKLVYERFNNEWFRQLMSQLTSYQQYVIILDLAFRLNNPLEPTENPESALIVALASVLHYAKHLKTGDRLLSREDFLKLPAVFITCHEELLHHDLLIKHKVIPSSHQRRNSL